MPRSASKVPRLAGRNCRAPILKCRARPRPFPYRRLPTLSTLTDPNLRRVSRLKSKVLPAPPTVADRAASCSAALVFSRPTRPTCPTRPTDCGRPSRFLFRRAARPAPRPSALRLGLLCFTRVATQRQVPPSPPICRGRWVCPSAFCRGRWVCGFAAEPAFANRRAPVQPEIVHYV